MRILTILLLALTGCSHLTNHTQDQRVGDRLDGVEDRQKGAIKSWSSGETLRSTDLNANFSHIHGLMVGGHGARLVDADVSSSAALSHSKLATPALVPKAWARINANCAFPCSETITAGSGVSVISHTATGVWTVTWTTARPTSPYGVLVGHHGPARTDCYSDTFSTTLVAVRCVDAAGAAVDTVWTVFMVDAP